MFKRYAFFSVFLGLFLFGAISDSIAIFGGECDPSRNLNPETGWEIEEYNVDITLRENGELFVREVIDVDFDIKKHGIFRHIPLIYSRSLENGDYVTSLLNIENIKVTQDGQDAIVKKSEVSNDHSCLNNLLFVDADTSLLLRIGDPDEDISGAHEYIIEYSVANVLSKNENGDIQLYWNGIGNGWPIRILKANIDVSVEQGVGLFGTQCFSGVVGSRQSNCKIDRSNDSGTIRVESSGPLGVGEGLTIISQVETSGEGVLDSNVGGGAKEYVTLLLKEWFFILPIFGYIFAIVVFLKKGRSPRTRGIVIPHFEPPGSVSPAFAGVLIDESLDKTDISSTILYFATRGYIKIRQEGKEYIFIRTDKEIVDGEISSEDALFLKRLMKFANDKGEVEIKDLKYKFSGYIDEYRGKIYDRGVSSGFFKQSSRFSNLWFLSIFVLWMILGVLVFILVSYLYGIVYIAFLFPVILLMSKFNIYSKKGKELKEEIEGLKLYLRTAEKDRLEFHNAPEKTPELFDYLLPYAMALGVVGIWAKAFKDIYVSPPDWYEGGGWNNFNTIVFANSLNSVSSNVNSTLSSIKPSSSSGGSFGGGGGFSGGGAGGGGGGSW